MRMKQTLDIINMMEADSIIGRYAIGDAVEDRLILMAIPPCSFDAKCSIAVVLRVKPCICKSAY